MPLSHGEPLVSIILTTYNRAEVLEQTIRMVQAQTYKNFELIICDDCSKDATREVCEKNTVSDSRIRYIRHERNVKMPANLNAGIRAAKGVYVANLHDGDIYSSTLIEKWKQALDEAPSAGMVFNQYQALHAGGPPREIYAEPLPAVTPGHDILEKIYFRRRHFGSPIWGTAMVRRSVYEELGVLDSRFGFIADVDMWMRIAERYDVAYVAEPLISLPARDDLPRQWGKGNHAEWRLLHQMFREARVRHFRRQPLHLGRELVRHYIYVSCHLTMRALCEANLWRRSLSASRQPSAEAQAGVSR